MGQGRTTISLNDFPEFAGSIRRRCFLNARRLVEVPSHSVPNQLLESQLVWLTLIKPVWKTLSEIGNRKSSETDLLKSSSSTGNR